MPHNPGLRRAIFVLLATLGASEAAWSQAPTTPTFTPTDAAIVGLSAGLYWAPNILGIHAGDPECLPCDRAELPIFDRWSVGKVRPLLSHLSTGVVLGLAVGIWADLWRAGPDGRVQVIASTESAALATGITVLMKEAVGRKRPVLYTDAATQVADLADQTRSWPSGHTSAAFALATSFVLSKSGGSAGVSARLAALGAAVAVGALRVASARHFPTDVVGGAAIGIGSALLVHTIRF